MAQHSVDPCTAFEQVVCGGRYETHSGYPLYCALFYVVCSPVVLHSRAALDGYDNDSNFFAARTDELAMRE